MLESSVNNEISASNSQQEELLTLPQPEIEEAIIEKAPTTKP